MLFIRCSTATHHQLNPFSRGPNIRESNITTVFLVSSCHLDVGFANTAANIVNKYFDIYFPAVIKTVEEMKLLGLEETLVFTTHPFLVYLYINCYAELGLHGLSAQSIADFTSAVHSGHITWHAFPFNAELKFYDVSLAEFGFQITHQLDKTFGRNPTITMSQRDVPGTTRSLLRLMVSRAQRPHYLTCLSLQRRIEVLRRLPGRVWLPNHTPAGQDVWKEPYNHYEPERCTRHNSFPPPSDGGEQC